jgi:hypothetical protein
LVGGVARNATTTWNGRRALSRGWNNRDIRGAISNSVNQRATILSPPLLIRSAHRRPRGERELTNARSNPKGSYPLGAHGSAGHADHLLGFWLDGHGAQHDEEHKAEIDAIDPDAARQAARTWFNPGAMR